MKVGRKPVVAKWIEEQQGKHHCQCGCGSEIEIKRHHYHKGVPGRCPGHFAKRVFPPEEFAQRFFDYFDTSAECWEWNRTKNQEGYGIISFHYRRLRAHRVIWMMTNGPIPPGLSVLHACDNPACVRPSHLFLGDHKANGVDMSQKGRSTRGEKGANSRITEAIVREIRARAARGERHKEIAKDFGLSRSHVTGIVTRAKWAHVP